MSNRISLALLLLALIGCDTRAVIGDRNDTGTVADAGPRMDDAYSGSERCDVTDQPRRDDTTPAPTHGPAAISRAWP